MISTIPRSWNLAVKRLKESNVATNLLVRCAEDAAHKATCEMKAKTSQLMLWCAKRDAAAAAALVKRDAALAAKLQGLVKALSESVDTKIRNLFASVDGKLDTVEGAGTRTIEDVSK